MSSTTERVQDLGAGWTEVRGEPFVAMPRADLHRLLIENQRLREALETMRELASVSLEDPWYAEQAGLDSSAIFKQAREALAGDAE